MAIHVRVTDDGSVDGDLDRVAAVVARARKTVALTGAGISVDSGIPDFRSPGGLWTRYDPMRYGTLTCFLEAPERAWELYRAIGRILAGRRPNPGHHALAELESAGRLAGVVTQNIDGLHQAAGARTVLEIHGGGSALKCLSCGGREPIRDAHLEPGPVPRCGRCERPLKPDYVLFEEPVREMDAILELLTGTDVLLVVGTSAQVTPACLLPERVRRSGGAVIEINVERELDEGTLGSEGARVQGRAASALPALVERVRAAGTVRR